MATATPRRTTASSGGEAVAMAAVAGVVRQEEVAGVVTQGQVLGAVEGLAFQEVLRPDSA